MKAVILAGGLGTRMREETEYRPKPMVEIGGKPILWHIMKFFSSQGIDEFLILVGYRGDQIKRYFLEFAAQNSDITISTDKLNQVQLHANASGGQPDAWKVTVVDTGRDSLTGKRLSLAASYVGDEDFFLTYGDGVSNVDLAALRDSHNESQALVTISIGHPVNRFGVVETNESGMVTKFTEKPNSRDKVNIGYMVCSPKLLKFIEGDEALEQGPLVRLSEQGLLHAYEHPGFFYAMDTLRDQEQLEKMWKSGKAEWATWK